MLLSLVTVRLSLLSLFLGSLRGVYPNQSNFDYDVMALCFYGVTVIDSCDFKLTGEREGGEDENEGDNNENYFNAFSHLLLCQGIKVFLFTPLL
jgi:hypothetical protein